MGSPITPFLLEGVKGQSMNLWPRGGVLGSGEGSKQVYLPRFAP